MSEIRQKIQQLKTTARIEQQLSAETRDKVLLDLAARLDAGTEAILAANQLDLARVDPGDPKYDRLRLTAERIQGVAADLRKVAALASPLGRVIEQRILANGIELSKISVPFGVIAVIYEARPNVTIDVFALGFKSGNGVVLKGGSEASNSNQIFYGLIQQSLAQANINPALIYLMPPDRAAVHELLTAVGLVDVCIPRGSQELISFVREHAKIPVIETGAGIVHTYFDLSGDSQIGAKVINNAKTRRVSVCNALDTLLIHAGRLADLPALVAPLALSRVIIYADAVSYPVLSGHYPAELLEMATAAEYGCEFLDYKLALKVVADVNEAITHIQGYTSGHSEAIIASQPEVISQFIHQVDAAVVYVNASTAFTDGGEFGMGAEIGISTQKLHARGPMALPELTSYKWLAIGSGQIR